MVRHTPASLPSRKGNHSNRARSRDMRDRLIHIRLAQVLQASSSSRRLCSLTPTMAYLRTPTRLVCLGSISTTLHSSPDSRPYLPSSECNMRPTLNTHRHPKLASCSHRSKCHHKIPREYTLKTTPHHNTRQCPRLSAVDNSLHRGDPMYTRRQAESLPCIRWSLKRGTRYQHLSVVGHH